MINEKSKREVKKGGGGLCLRGMGSVEASLYGDKRSCRSLLMCCSYSFGNEFQSVFVGHSRGHSQHVKDFRVLR